MPVIRYAKRRFMKNSRKIILTAIRREECKGAVRADGERDERHGALVRREVHDEKAEKMNEPLEKLDSVPYYGVYDANMVLNYSVLRRNR